MPQGGEVVSGSSLYRFDRQTLCVLNLFFQVDNSDLRFGV